MLTHFRHQPPRYTGDWKVDGPIWSKAISDYWLSLEKKGALAIQPIDISHLPMVAVKDWIPPGSTDHTRGIREAAEALSAAGGGVLAFEPGKTYTVWTSDNNTIIDLSDLSGVTVLGNGCIIESAATGANDVHAKFIDVHGASNIRVEGFNFRGCNNSLIANQGERFIYGYTATNIAMLNCDIRDCVQGVYFDGTGDPCNGLLVQNCYFNRVYYPLNLYDTNGIVASYKTVNAGRSFACNGPSNNIDLSLDSEHGGPFSDVILSIVADSALTEAANTISNVRINYRSAGRYSGSGDQNVEEALVKFAFGQLDGDSSAGHLRNVHVNFCVDCGASDQHRNALYFQRTKSDGTADDQSRVHTIRNFVVTGSLLNWNNALASGLQFFPVTYGGNTVAWSGDLIEGICIRDFHIKGAAPTDAIYVNGQGNVSGKRFVTFDNVEFDGTATFVNYAGADIQGYPLDWTIGVSFGGGTTGITYSTRAGTFQRDGDFVKFAGYALFSSKGSSTGIAAVTGLPFTVANVTAMNGACSFAPGAITFTGQTQPTFNTNTTTIALQQCTEAGARSNLTDANFANDSEIRISGVYRCT